jgi:putative ABC transport system permease protein
VRVTANLLSPENNLQLATGPALLAPSLKRNLPEIAEAVRIQEEAVTVKWQNRLYRENDFCKSDQSIFAVFDFVFIEGSPVNALKAPNSIVVNRSVARKYFGQSAALGKTLICNNKPLLVTGVIEDRPSNSDLNIPALISGDFDKTTKWLDMGCFSFDLGPNPIFNSFRKSSRLLVQLMFSRNSIPRAQSPIRWNLYQNCSKMYISAKTSWMILPRATNNIA